MEDNIIKLVDEEGKDFNFEVLDIIEDDNKRYAVGVPYEDDSEDEEEGTVLIMRIVSLNEDEDMLEPIENDDELQKIFAMFKERIDEDFEYEVE